MVKIRPTKGWKWIPIPLFILILFLLSRSGPPGRGVEVVDGDTIVVHGERIRYIGIDTPEWDEPFFEEAKRRNEELLSGKQIRIEPCREERYDKYGRLLAWVYANGTLVNTQLLKEGLARALIIPPCGKEKERLLLDLEREARKKGLGIWSIGKKAIPPTEAGRYIGEYKAVRGKVLSTYRSEKVVFLNFGKDYRRDFTVVIFSRDLGRFERRGISPETYYRGKEVIVTGRIEEYNGPEIVVNDPSQIWVVE